MWSGKPSSTPPAARWSSSPACSTRRSPPPAGWCREHWRAPPRVSSVGAVAVPRPGGGGTPSRGAARGRAGQIQPELTELADLVRQLAVVHGRVTLSSGKEADYYVDLRRATLHHRAAPLIGRLVRELTADWDYAAVGGLTLGADPVATAVMHAPGRPIDAFVVRKSVKSHGMQRLIEGPDISGQRVLVVEDTSTTGGSALTAVRAVLEAGAQVVGVATVVDRATGAAEAIEAEGFPYRSVLGLADLGLQ